MRLRLLVLCAGIAAHSRMRSIPSEHEWWLTAAALLVALVLAVGTSVSVHRTKSSRHIRFAKHSLCLSLLFICGFFWAMLMAQIQFLHRLPPQLEGVDFWVNGRIEGLVRREPVDPQSAAVRNQRSQQFDLRVDFSCLRLLPEQCTEADQSSVLAGQLVTLNDYAQLPIKSGERWRLRVRVNRPHGFSNPGGYDFEAGQFQRGIMARGYIRETSFNTRLEPENKPFADLRERLNISRLRAALADDIDQLSGLSNKGLLKALVIGDRDNISNTQWDLFTATGTNHLVVISGLHVGFVALCAWTLVNRLSRLFPALLLRVPAQHLAACAAILAAVGYSLLAGFSLPTQRALIMITVLMSGRLSGRSVRPGDSLSLAALLVLMMDPMAVTQAGFWLSFAAVASLCFAFSGYGSFDNRPAGGKLSGPERRSQLFRQTWQRWIQPQWAVSVGLLLPLLLWTGQMSLNAPVANVFAIPLVSLLVVPLALIGSLLVSLDVSVIASFAALLLQLADTLLHWLQIFLTGISSWTPGLWRPPAPSLLSMLLMAVASVVLLMPRGIAPRWLALPMLMPLIWPTPQARPAAGRVWLQFLDVGQGLAVAVHTHQHDLLFDAGPALGPDFDAGRAVILPYLYQSHIHDLDSLIISHWHADHSGGLVSVIENLEVRQKLTGHLPSTAPLAAGVSGFETCEAGAQWRWDDVNFSVLFPAPDTRITSRTESGNINNSSCVLLIEAGDQRVLLTGDIEEPAERWLLREHGDNLSADVLQAPHHGSRSSSSPAFVQATAARWVIMSAGHRNRFDHPHAEVVERYQSNNAQVLFTADSGAILIELGGEEPVVLARNRQQQRRFWFNL